MPGSGHPSPLIQMDCRLAAGNDRNSKRQMRPRAHRAVGRWPPASHRTGRRGNVTSRHESAGNLGTAAGQVKVASTLQDHGTTVIGMTPVLLPSLVSTTVFSESTLRPRL